MSKPITSFKDTFLSNMHIITNPITDKHGINYYSSENAYMSAKTNNMDNKHHIASLNPYEAKKYGKTVVLITNWNNVKLSIMKQILYQKFNNNPNLMQQLIDTGDSELIEGNTWHDYYWGVCNNKGENNLGKLLMKIRN